MLRTYPAAKKSASKSLTPVGGAVRIRLISDVPLGALLSGGTDSSTVVALMARASSNPVKTFAIGFRHADLMRPITRNSRPTVWHGHHELVLEPKVVETVESLTRSLEEPFGDSSMLPLLCFLSGPATRHCRLSGTVATKSLPAMDAIAFNRDARSSSKSFVDVELVS